METNRWLSSKKEGLWRLFVNLGVEDPPISRAFLIIVLTSDLGICVSAVISVHCFATSETSSTPLSTSTRTCTSRSILRDFFGHLYDCYLLLGLDHHMTSSVPSGSRPTESLGLFECETVEESWAPRPSLGHILLWLRLEGRRDIFHDLQWRGGLLDCLTKKQNVWWTQRIKKL